MTYADRSRPNPYVGPRAFRRGERLHGRERESMDLLHLLDAERIVLLYSRSGAGKTSLIEASLLPKLERRKLEVLPTMRVNLPLPSDAELPATTNPYVLSLLRCLEGRTGGEEETGRKISSEELERLSGMTLKEYLGDHLETSKGKKLMLVFDQFEEILSIDPTNPTAKKEFFEQVGSALRDRRCWALFAMREDFVAGLDPYLRLMPTRLGTTYRLELLDEKAALLAIQRPAKQEDVEFTDVAARKLVDDLRQTWVQQPDGTMVEKKGVYVEPVQLQVVCHRLWEELPEGANRILEKDVEAIGDVDSALADYYAARVAATAAKTGVSERAIREWFDRHLITQQGIRGQVLHRPKQSRGLDNRAIWDLVNAHLVRAEKRRGATWFELAHDRLIRPLRQNNDEWYRAQVSTSLTLRIRKHDPRTKAYPVEATLDDGSFFYGGRLHVDQQAQQASEHDPQAYGAALFEALIAGPIRRAYDEAISRAAAQTQDRLRLRLWIDDEASELHSLPWERLRHTHRGETAPLATSSYTSFSRYVGLPIVDPSPVSERPVRVLVAMSSPRDLPRISIDHEMEGLCEALGDLQRHDLLQVTVMPGYRGLTSKLRARLERDRYGIVDGTTGLRELLRLLPAYHVLHFHGYTSQDKQGNSALIFEGVGTMGDPIEAGDLGARLAAVPLPHLVFLSTSEHRRTHSEAQHANVMLAPRLVQAGVPAVVAFLGGIPTANGHRLVSDIYTQLFEHGLVDNALNLARSELYKSEDPTWPNPVLFTRLQHGHLFGTHLVLDDTPDHEEYRDLLVHVRLEDEIREIYTVEATLDDGSIFSGGELLLNQTVPADKRLGLTEFGPDVFDILGYQGVDSGEFGLQLLDALFSGATRPAYDKAIDRAETQAEGRLRFRLWIDENASKLHDTPWELLHRASGSQPVPLTASVKTPFSRYTALETPERQPIGGREYPLRLLIAISNPSDQPAMDIELAVESFRQAMAEPIRRDLVRVTLMPGLSGLSPDVQRQLKAGGFRIKGGATGLASILQLLPHVHIFHFIGRGYRDWHKDQVILFFENADGKAHLVFGGELVTKLADIKLPHLVFLSSADTVSLGSQMSRLGIPAVVAMQGHVEEEHLLTREFYHQLLTHGVVDRALNQARLTVFEPEQADWARPVLFMRLPQGQLFNPDPLKTK